jgi:hypothetical protein
MRRPPEYLITSSARASSRPGLVRCSFEASRNRDEAALTLRARSGREPLQQILKTQLTSHDGGLGQTGGPAYNGYRQSAR